MTKWLATVIGSVCFAFSIFLVFPPQTSAAPQFAPLPIPVSIAPVTLKCIVGGCSNILCVDASNAPPNSTCEWRDSYACYQNARCEVQADGHCGWTMTPELQTCLSGDSNPGNPNPPSYPTPTPTPKSEATCGNNICEPGEADSTYCPPCTGDICPMRPCSYYVGTCPSDCPAPKPTTKPTPTPTLTSCTPPKPTPTCTVPPACIYTTPPCEIMVPLGGWCPRPTTPPPPPIPTAPPGTCDNTCPGGTIQTITCRCLDATNLPTSSSPLNSRLQELLTSSDSASISPLPRPVTSLIDTRPHPFNGFTNLIAFINTTFNQLRHLFTY